jgi:hypothetical protein
MGQQDNERAHQDRVYRACGLALSWAQFFEAEIVNAVLCHSITRNKFLVRSQAVRFLFDTEKRPLRQLLREVLKRARFEPDVTGTLFEAIERRNFLVHKYFWDRMEDFATEEGRYSMLEELRELTQLFYSAHKFASMITDLYSEQLGVSRDAIEEEMNRFKNTRMP